MCSSDHMLAKFDEVSSGQLPHLEVRSCCSSIIWIGTVRTVIWSGSILKLLDVI